MADSAVSFVLGRLGEFVVKEAGVLQEVGSDVVLFRDKLQWLHTFVQQADHRRRRRGGGSYMDVWVQQTREVALDVEDVLDEFMLRVSQHQGLPAWKKWLRFLTTCATQISVRRELSGRIAMIRARLDQISDHKSSYITEYSSSATCWASPPISTTDGWDDELEVVGLEEERLSLERLLLEGDKRRSIVSIVGESGIGKFTLAEMVLKSPVVKRHFEARAILVLPPCASVAYALKWIYHRLCPFKGTPAISEEIHSAVSSHLKDKSYLIVVAGADNLFNWSSVLDALPDNDLGSRVVIISSIKATLNGLDVHELRVHHLDQKNSNILFCRHALGVGSRNQHPNKSFGSKLHLLGSQYREAQMDEACEDSLESEYEKHMDRACKDMFEVTSGLPLAILLLGRLLRRKEFPEQWRDVLRHLKSMKPSSRLEGILALCFDDLPHHLKSCFLYFAMMPQNMSYNGAVLVRVWAAEGFLKHRKGQSMEDVGHHYLKELISRGMISLLEKGCIASEGSMAKKVVIHKRLHAMARHETQEGSFLDIYDITDIPSSTPVRHLFIQNLTSTAYTQMEDASFPKLRSVRCNFSEYWENKDQERLYSAVDDQSYHKNSLRYFGRSKLLRVIEFKGLQVKKLPRMIGCLIHLRYLCIRNSCLVELPSTISNLINLQTLDIRKSKVKKVTPAFWGIRTLRHVIASKLHLPKSVGVLKNMQTLGGMVCVHPWHNNISPIHNMINLRHLEISKLTSHHWGALSDAFKQLESLLELQLIGDDIPFNLFTKYSLQRLQLLYLCGQIIMGPEETEELWSLPNLTRLELQNSTMNPGFINKIGKLPRLAELVLRDEAYEGEELVFSKESGFCNLTHLELYSLSGLSKWKIGSESLMKVEQIIVHECTNMRLQLEGEQVLKNLKEFRVIDMPDNWGVEEAGALSEKFIRVTMTN
ncbi:hypothetical protein ACP70R_028779 [Stipagrostis hirtigluma subsp. patula]